MKSNGIVVVHIQPHHVFSDFALSISASCAEAKIALVYIYSEIFPVILKCVSLLMETAVVIHLATFLFCCIDNVSCILLIKDLKSPGFM